MAVERFIRLLPLCLQPKRLVIEDYSHITLLP
jgi:hypothetical protein